MTGIFIRERRGSLGYRDTEKTQGRSLCEDEGRDFSDVSTSQRMPRIPRSHQKLGRGKEEFCPKAGSGNVILPIS